MEGARRETSGLLSATGMAKEDTKREIQNKDKLQQSSSSRCPTPTPKEVRSRDCSPLRKGPAIPSPELTSPPQLSEPQANRSSSLSRLCYAVPRTPSLSPRAGYADHLHLHLSPTDDAFSTSHTFWVPWMLHQTCVPSVFPWHKVNTQENLLN